MAETLRLVTRFNEHTNDLEVIGIGTNNQEVDKIIQQDFQERGIIQFRKVASVGMPKLEPHRGVTFVRDITSGKGVVLTYTITEIVPNVAISIGRF